MIINPIIPIWIMLLLCILMFLFRSKNKNVLIRQLIVIFLIFILNLRIMIPSNDVKVFSNNLDVLFIIDSTLSMIAEDYNGNTSRMEAVKKDCLHIIDELQGAKFSLITFNNSAKTVMPYTTDSQMVKDAINTIPMIDKLYARGSGLNISLDEIANSLESSKKKENRNRIIFFISDGEITNGEALNSFSSLKKYIDSGAILGYGTKKGGYMKVKELFTNEITYVQDTSKFPTEKAVSKIDEDNLKKIAEDVGITYIHMDKTEKIDDTLKEIKNLIKNNIDQSTKSSFSDIYYIFSLMICIILMYEFVGYKRRF